MLDDIINASSFSPLKMKRAVVAQLVERMREHWVAGSSPAHCKLFEKRIVKII